jgi:hypothetical protein
MGKPFQTINAVLSVLTRGDTVWLASGTYDETVDIENRSGSGRPYETSPQTDLQGIEISDEYYSDLLGCGGARGHASNGVDEVSAMPRRPPLGPAPGPSAGARAPIAR